MLTVNQGEQYLISPFTKEKIPASSISSHTKYGKNILVFFSYEWLVDFQLYLIEHGFNDEKKKWLNNKKKNKFMNQVMNFIDSLFLLFKILFRFTCWTWIEKICRTSYRYFWDGCPRNSHWSKGKQKRIFLQLNFIYSSRLAKKIDVLMIKCNGMVTQQQVKHFFLSQILLQLLFV